VWSDNRHVLAWVRRHPRFGSLLGVANLHDSSQSASADLCRDAGLAAPRDVLQLWPATLRDGRINLPPLSVVWLTDG
jgi:amylosucrase